MSLKRLEIANFRNLHSVSIEPDAGLNLITGDNAAGKTSLLEAIFYISYGRSFRSSQIKHLIEHEHTFFRLIAQTDNPENHIGIERHTSEQTIRVNKQSVNSISELSSLLPLIALHPDSHQLISAGPDHRRQFLDWGVFHVEHAFIESWKNFKKALSQRNAALRMQQTDKLCNLWNKELVENANIIESMRLSYLEKICVEVDKISDILFPGHLIELSYRRGWSSDTDYADYLLSNLAKDREKGFTQSGPHRADLKITLDGQAAQSSISRGQQKKLVCLLKIAQLALFSALSNQRSILLFDDLPAELDTDNQNKIMSILSKMNIQLFITAIESEQINCKDWENYKVFHVEHGNVEVISPSE